MTSCRDAAKPGFLTGTHGHQHSNSWGGSDTAGHCIRMSDLIPCSGNSRSAYRRDWFLRRLLVLTNQAHGWQHCGIIEARRDCPDTLLCVNTNRMAPASASLGCLPFGTSRAIRTGKTVLRTADPLHRRLHAFPTKRGRGGL